MNLNFFGKKKFNNSITNSEEFISPNRLNYHNIYININDDKCI